jgi:predicted amidohydrolase
MIIALAQFNPTVGDFEGNSARILEMAHQAQSRGAELALFSELCLCGYPPQDLTERPAFDELNQKELLRLAKKIPLPSLVGYVGGGQTRRQLRRSDRQRQNPLRTAQNAVAHIRRV